MASTRRFLLLALIALVATANLAEAASKTRSQATTGEARGKGATAKAGEARDKAAPTNKRAGSSGASGSASGKKAARSQQPAVQTAGSKRQGQQEMTMGVKQQRTFDGHVSANGTRVAGGKGHTVNGTRHVNGTRVGGRRDGSGAAHSVNATRRAAVNGTDGRGRPQRGGAAGGGSRAGGAGAGGRAGGAGAGGRAGAAGGGGRKEGGRAGGGHGGRAGSVIGVVGARMTGEQMVGSAGMANATGRLELTLVKTATDMDVHYSLSLAHLSSPSPPTAASIHSGPASSPSAALLLAFPASAWTNTTRPVHRATNATAAPPPAAARFSYGARGVWGNASSLSAAAGGSVAAAVSSILAAPASFHALIATSTFPQGAVRGQMGNLTRAGK